MSAKIKEFNRTNARELVEECCKALEPIAKKYGLTLDEKGRSFYRDRLPMKFDLIVPVMDEKGEALDPKAQEFKKKALRVGLEPDDLHREFKSRGETYRIVGLNLRAKKYPVLGERVRDGKRFKFHVDTVRNGLKPKAA